MTTTTITPTAIAAFPFGYTADAHGVRGLGRKLTFEQLGGQATWHNLHPEFQRRTATMMLAASVEGVPLGIGTGWRSFAEQQAGFEHDPKGHARPGNSNHEGFPGGNDGDRTR